MIRIKIYKAGSGDAFLLSFGSGNDFNILIDMGWKSTFQSSIKKDLQILQSKGKRINLLVITHIDNDHLNGAISLLKENIESNKIIKIEEIWYNSYKHLMFSKDKSSHLLQEEKKILEKIISLNTLHHLEDGAKEINAENAETFTELLYKYKYNWNIASNNKAITVETLPNHSFNDIIFTLLSPSDIKLKLLADEWKDYLDSKKYDFQLSNDELNDKAFELYMQRLREITIQKNEISSNEEALDFEQLALIEENDTKVTNGSSIAFIIQYHNNKLLFLGDAHEEQIFERLEQLKQNGHDLNFDIVKLSHHGSNKNISNRILQMINARYFIISSDGIQHKHPDIETISKIITQKSNHTKNLIFNYGDNPILKTINKDDLKEEYNFNIIISNNIECNGSNIQTN